ncbi:MAG: LysM peptidoglycan-binding domain-containing protein [Anaerolineae bacterium]|nr:LysM peptidoglycan-binding domain-containing protein [Anaerolineae bacterium]
MIEQPPVVQQPPVVEPPISEPEPATPPAPETPAKPLPATSLTYTVQQGETLWGIAKKFGTTVDALVQANNISDRSKIRAGQRLIIPR